MLRPVGTANRNVTVIEQRLEKRSWSRLQTKDQQLTMQIQSPNFVAKRMSGQLACAVHIVTKIGRKSRITIIHVIHATGVSPEISLPVCRKARGQKETNRTQCD